MTAKLIILAIAVACSSCGEGQSEQADQSTSPVENQSAAMPIAKPDTIKPGEVGALPDDRVRISEGTIDTKGPQGAGQVLQRFGALLEQRRFAEAYQLWSDDGRASGVTEAAFVAAYNKYAEIHSEVGTPGAMEGAAGSAYIDIPFRFYGRLKSGEPFNLVGPVTLRRVNDVPGSTPQQRQWHIYRTDLQPRP